MGRPVSTADLEWAEHRDAARHAPDPEPLDPSDADVDPVTVTAEQVAEYVAALNAHVAAMREAS